MYGFQSPGYRNRLQNPQVWAGEVQEGKCCTVKHVICSFFPLPSSCQTQRAPSTAAAHLERFTHLARCPSWSESPCTASHCPQHHFPFAQFCSHGLVPPPQSIYTESLHWALFWGNLSKGTNSGNFRLFPGCGFSIWKARSSGKVRILSGMYSTIVLAKRPYMRTLRPNSSLYHCVILLLTYCLTVALSHFQISRASVICDGYCKD